MIITKSADIVIHPEKDVLQLLAAGNGPLTQLFKTVHELSIYENKLKSLLTSPLKDNLRLVKFQQGIIVLVASSPAWATQAKFHSSDLLAALRKDRAFAGTVSIQIKVQAAFSTTKPVVDEKSLSIERVLPKHAAQTISALADKLVHEGLRDALRGLAEHGISSTPQDP